MEQNDFIDAQIEDLEKKLGLARRALLLAFRRDGLADQVSRTEVSTTALSTLQVIMDPKELDGAILRATPRPRENADQQAVKLMLYFLGLAPQERTELVERHLADVGIYDSKARDQVHKQLAKLLAVHAALSHLLLRAAVESIAVDSEQLALFKRVALHPVDPSSFD